MTSAERERAVAYLKETRTAVLDSTRGLTEAQWRHKPSPEAWSIGECVEHLAVVETGLLRALERIPSSPAATEEELVAALGKEEMIVKAVPSRGRRVKGPPHAMPKGEWTDPDALRERFTEVRERLIVFASTTTHPLRTRQFPHPFLGQLDGFQWLMFLAAHSERHRRQLEEVKTSAGYPGNEMAADAH